MSDTGNTCQGCGKPQKPATLYCTSCGLPVASAPSGADDTDIPTVIAPAKRAAAGGNARPGGGGGGGKNTAAGQPPTVAISPAQPAGPGAQGGAEWRPGQDWSPGTGWQQEQQIPWWLTPPQQGQQGFNQQGLGQQGFGPQGAGLPGTGTLGTAGASPQVPPGGGHRSSRLPLIAVTIAVVALLGAGASVLLSSLSPTSSTPTPTTPAPTPTTGGPSERQAATTLNGLLSQSSQDRAAISAAYSDGQACSNLASDESTFKQAAANRQALLGQLGSLQGASTLPSQMLSDLTSAWQVSIQADDDYAQWISDENTSGCTQQDPSFQAAATPNNEATMDKSAFISLWNPIAAQYGLTQYNQSTL